MAPQKIIIIKILKNHLPVLRQSLCQAANNEGGNTFSLTAPAKNGDKAQYQVAIATLLASEYHAGSRENNYLSEVVRIPSKK